jgi:ATP-dependent metalloprotease
VISEAWSWSKFSRKLGSRVLYGLLLMTGLSVILDQQGIIKSGMLWIGCLLSVASEILWANIICIFRLYLGMATAEVEPNNLQDPIKFEDVQGVDEAKQDLEEIVQFLKEPRRFTEMGGKLPKGMCFGFVVIVPFGL